TYADYEIAITCPTDRGRGHGTTVTRLLLTYAFQTLGLPRVRLLVEGRNHRAIACYTKAGFCPVVRLRDGRTVIYTMVAINPTLSRPAPLVRTVQLPAHAAHGRRLQLTAAELGFLGSRPGEPVAIEGAAGELLITTPTPDAPEGEDVSVRLTEEERDRLLLVAAQLGLSPSGLISELLAHTAAAASPAGSGALTSV
ncbi:MAG: GNAT family N-acetyltransferase, partial [Chloroflexota bacterium]|nr:GNAT family N-acetyltransferase [Chloroflexota bacterium]